MTSTNQHQRLATYYILGTSLTCIVCFILARTYGLYGAAASLLISEFVMNLYVVPASLRIARDTLPAFLAGLAEDLTKRQSPRRRLFFTVVSASLAAWALGAIIQRTDIPGLDWAVSFIAPAIFVTVFSYYMLGDALRDYLDPRLKSR